MIENELPSYGPFRHYNKLALLKYLWDDPAKIREVYNSRNGATYTQDDMHEFVVEELLTIYGILNSEQRECAPKEILSELRKDRVDAFIGEEITLNRGLRWLELQGFPVLRSQLRWFVSGIARNILQNIEEDHDNKGKMDFENIARRIRMAMEIRGLTIKDIDCILKDMRPKISFNSFIYSLRRGEVSTFYLDSMLGALSKILGIEAVWFRTGYKRAEWEINVFKKLPGMTIGQRIEAFRWSEGLSQAQLAARLGWGVGKLQHLERVEDRMPPHQFVLLFDGKDWSFLADALGLDDAFPILAGYDKSELARHFSQGDILRICRLNLRKGWTQTELAVYLGVTTTSVVSWEAHSKLPEPIFREALAKLYGFSVEELFGTNSLGHLKIFREHFMNRAVSIKEFREKYRKPDDSLYNEGNVRANLRQLIKLGLAKRTKPGYYELTDFARRLSDKQVDFMGGMPGISKSEMRGNELEMAKRRIYGAIRDVLTVRDKTLLFLGNEVREVPLLFIKILDKLDKIGGTNRIVILVEDKEEQKEAQYRLRLPAGVVTNRCNVMIFEEVGVNMQRAESGFVQILGIDGLRCAIYNEEQLRNMQSRSRRSSMPLKNFRICL